MKVVSLIGLFMVSMVACGKKPVPVSPKPASANECVELTTCNASDELVPEIVQTVLNELPPPVAGANGSQGAQGVQGPQGLQGDKGDTGAPGKDAAPVTLSTSTNTTTCPNGGVTLSTSTGSQDLCNGLNGSPGQSVTLSTANATDCVNGGVTLVGSNGSVSLCNGAPGLPGNPGQNGIGNTSSLSATRIYSPSVTDYVGTTNVVNATVFVPPIVSVVYGNQNTGNAYVDFGTTRCTYVGNNKAGSALALYNFLNCKDSTSTVVASMTPGNPFTYTGNITLSVGDGADTSVPTQVSVIMQINY